MRIELSGQEQLLSLRDYLRRLGCLAFIADDERSLDAYTDAGDADDEQLQLRVWIAARNRTHGGDARPLSSHRRRHQAE